MRVASALVRALVPLLVPSCVSLAFGQEQEPGYLGCFRQGYHALRAGEPERAAELFERCLEIEPDSPVAPFYLACAAARADEADRALAALERAFANGHGDPGLAARELDLEGLRELPRFQHLLDGARPAAAERQSDSTLPDRAIEWRFGTDHPTFCPNGKRFATLGFELGFLWDAESGELLHVLDNGRSSLEQIAFSPDGLLLATIADDGGLEIWSGETGELLRELGEVRVARGSLAWSSDGKTVCTTEVGALVAFWDVESGKVRFVLPCASPSLTALSPDGKHAFVIATEVAKAKAILWDVAECRRIAQLPLRDSRDSWVEFDARGELAIVFDGGERDCYIVEAATGRKVSTVPSMDDLGAVEFLPGTDLLITTDRVGQLRWWHARTGKCVRTVQAHEQPLYYLWVSDDGRFAMTHTIPEGTRLWDARSGEELWATPDRLDRGWTAESARFRPGGEELLTAQRGGDLLLRASATGALVRRIDNPVLALGDPAASPEGKDLAVLGGDGLLRLFSGSSCEPLARSDLGGGRRGSARYSSDGRWLAAIVGEEDVVLVRTAGLEPVHHLKAYAKRTNHWYPRPRELAFSPDGKRLLTWRGGLAPGLWEVESGRLIARLEGHEGEVRYAAWSPDGKRIATAGDDSDLRLRDGRDGREIGPMIDDDWSIGHCTFGPTGDLLATTSLDSTANVYRLPEGERLHSFLNPQLWGEDDLDRTCFTPDGSRLLSLAAYGSVACWDLSGGEMLWRNWIWSGVPARPRLHFSEDGKRVTILTELGGQSLVDLESGAVLGRYEGRGSYEVLREEGAELLVGVAEGLHWLEWPEGRTRCNRLELGGGDAFIYTPELFFSGALERLPAARLRIGRIHQPLESMVGLLYDPKRVQAAAEGYRLSPARITK